MNKIHLLCVNHEEPNEVYIQVNNIASFRRINWLFSKYRTKIVLNSGEVIKSKLTPEELINTLNKDLK